MKTAPTILLLVGLCGCCQTPQPPPTVEPPRVVPITVIPTFTVDPSREYERKIWELKQIISHMLTEKFKTNTVVILNPPELNLDFEVRTWGYEFDRPSPTMIKIKSYNISIMDK